ncbi:hypothetical protein B0T22DRAFT_402361 [Podospora appendiculata]|uniref:Crossover junction endonuclease MUS81 n=1 Tax=Podospora appendiculata TaxID=314037 RepID=A0AAE0XIF5_9PEZI|nr:hypothetical protein B0T22DRAFT_402361 [Podospora appendiculata]
MAQNTSANPLYLEWVKEWWDTARERNSKGVATYKHAYDSLKACPIAFGHPGELQQLKGFGPKLCERLAEQMKKHCEENGLPMPTRGRKKRGGRAVVGSGGGDGGADGDDGEEDARPVKKARKVKAYVPAYRSGAYAIVMALSEPSAEGQVGLPKNELIDKAQPFCDASFTAPPDPTKFYTAWASIKTLEQKELVYERGRPLKRYALTDEGWEVAKRIRQMTIISGATGTGIVVAAGSGSGAAAKPETRAPHPVVPTIALDDDDDDDDEKEAYPIQAKSSQFSNVVADGNAVPDDSALPTLTPIRMQPGTFTVELVLDVREVRAKTDRDYMQQQLTKLGIKPIMRSLELGDALWVAKHKQPNWLDRLGAEGDEVVLDWIVERKRLDDLIGSIKDGRFHEQKFRLRRAGLKNVIYLVEEISLDPTHFQKSEEMVQSAIASIQVVNGYFLKKTQMMDETIRYLASMTRLLKKVYESKPLHVVPTKVLTAKNYLPLMKCAREKHPSVSHHISYPAFASLASKSDMMTLRDVYLKMLMCTRGVTGEKAVEIQKIWKTPYELAKAYEGCGTGEEGKKKRANLVAARLGHLVGHKKIAKALSQKIAESWGD